HLGDRRQIELHMTPATRRNDAVEAEPHRPDIAVEGECHSLPGEGRDFALEQSLGDARGVVSAPRRLAGGIAGLTLDEVALGGALDLIIQERFRHGWVSLDPN